MVDFMHQSSTYDIQQVLRQAEDLPPIPPHIFTLRDKFHYQYEHEEPWTRPGVRSTGETSRSFGRNKGPKVIHRIPLMSTAMLQPLKLARRTHGTCAETASECRIVVLLVWYNLLSLPALLILGATIQSKVREGAGWVVLRPSLDFTYFTSYIKNLVLNY